MKKLVLLFFALTLALSACGRGTRPAAATPVPGPETEAPAAESSAGPPDYAGLVSCYHFSLMAVRSGELYGWGDEVLLQWVWRAYEDGSVRYTGGEDVSAVFCTRMSFAWIDADGALWGVNWPPWGYRQDPPLAMSETVKLMEGVKTAALDQGCLLAVDEEGVLWAWGEVEHGGTNGEPPFANSPKKLMEGVRAVSARDGAYYAVREDGSLWGWGRIGIDDGTGRTSRAAPERLLEGIKQVSAGRQSLAVGEDGSLWAWGAPELPGTAQSPFAYFKGGRPEKIMDEASYAASGCGHWAVVRQDGSLWTWGSNRNGALGDGSEEYRTEPIRVMENMAFAVCGRENIYAVGQDGTLFELGTDLRHIYKPLSHEDPEIAAESRRPHKLLDGIL